MKKKTGRPTKYRGEETCRQASIACQLGATDADLASLFAVNEDTINEWKRVHPEFSESLKSKNHANDKVRASLFQRACGYSHPAVKIFCYEGQIIEAPYVEHYPPETAAAFIWLKNRDPENWKDKHEHKHEGNITVIINRKPKADGNRS